MGVRVRLFTMNVCYCVVYVCAEQKHHMTTLMERNVNQAERKFITRYDDVHLWPSEWGRAKGNGFWWPFIILPTYYTGSCDYQAVVQNFYVLVSIINRINMDGLGEKSGPLIATLAKFNYIIRWKVWIRDSARFFAQCRAIMASSCLGIEPVECRPQFLSRYIKQACDRWPYFSACG